jgi:hypothetical protein
MRGAREDLEIDHSALSHVCQLEVIESIDCVASVHVPVHLLLNLISVSAIQR